MAKRKRLTPADPAVLGAAPETKAYVNGWEGVRRPPIADVAGDAATQAAFDEVAGELAAARKDGRLIQRLPIDVIDEAYLVRDRIAQDDADMDALVASLRARGQQTPIEVVELGTGRYGLISGWRRLMALKTLHADGAEGDFAHVQSLVRAPKDTPDAYIAMVEENEIRANLSFYERARIAARAAEQGAYPTARHAVKGLFANAPSARRSKINSFVTIYAQLDSVLQFPAALSEKQGLSLAKALSEDTSTASRIEADLRAAKPATAQAEWSVLAAALGGTAKSSKQTNNVITNPAQGLKMVAAKGRVTLSGPAVDDALLGDLQGWLAARKA
jgi:ParB/RepB/Spo0J family partition protein